MSEQPYSEPWLDRFKRRWSKASLKDLGAGEKFYADICHAARSEVTNSELHGAIDILGVQDAWQIEVPNCNAIAAAVRAYRERVSMRTRQTNVSTARERLAAAPDHKARWEIICADDLEDSFYELRSYCARTWPDFEEAIAAHLKQVFAANRLAAGLPPLGDHTAGVGGYSESDWERRKRRAHELMDQYRKRQQQPDGKPCGVEE